MGYPMISGYRGKAASGAAAGLSKMPGAPAAVGDAINSLEKFIGDKLPKLPANDLAKLPLRRWFRYLPWLKDFMFGLQLEEVYRSAANLSGYVQNCTRAASACDITTWGMIGIGGTPTCAGTWYPPPSFPGMLPAGLVEMGQFTGFGGVGCGILRNTNFQNKGWKALAGNTIPPFRYYPWPKGEPLKPLEVPWAQPWDEPITQPLPQYPSIPYPALPYQPHPWDDPSPLERPVPRTPPVPRPRPEPQPKPRPRPRPDRPDPPVTPLPRWFTPGTGIGRGTGPALEPFITVRQSDAFLHKPPGKRVTEQKLTSRLGRFAWYLAHVVTESRDVLQGLWKALPDNMKTKQKKAKGLGKHGDRRTPPIPKMFKDVTSGIRQINQYDENHPWADETDRYWSRAVDEIAANLFQDYVHGKLGQAVARESARSGRPVGYAAGPAL